MSGDKLPIVERLETGASMLKQAGFAFHREHEAMSQAATTITELVSALEEAANEFDAVKEFADADDTLSCWKTAKDAADRIDALLSNTRGDTREQSQ